MPIQRERVNLSLPPYLVKKLHDVGRQNRLHSTDGSLQNASIITDVLKFICDVQSDDDVDKHLNNTGGTLLDLIRRSVKSHIDNSQ